MEMNDANSLCRLELVGITYNQIESGVYAIILEEVGGTRRIPIIIGAAEAQSIECKLQEIITPRPLTHDLFVNALSAFGIRVKEVRLRRLPNGVFASDLVLYDGISEIVIDSRSSDAIAIAVRTDSPIYATRRLIEETGFERQDSSSGNAQSSEKQEKADDKHTDELETMLSTLDDKRLEEILEREVSRENYEAAKRIKDELDRRKNG